MDMIKRFLGVFLVATGVAVALNLILTPVYHDGSADYPVWKVLNWFMAAGVIVTLVVSFLRRRAPQNEETGLFERLQTSMDYYGSIVLAMLFFWGWIRTLNPDSETGDAVTSHLIYFPITDALYVVLTLAIGSRLWKDGGSSSA